MTAETAARVLAGGGVKRTKADGGSARSSNGSGSNGSSGAVSTHSNGRKVGARGPMAKPVDPDAQCACCHVRASPQWRTFPGVLGGASGGGTVTLCNACGVRYAPRPRPPCLSPSPSAARRRLSMRKLARDAWEASLTLTESHRHGTRRRRYARFGSVKLPGDAADSVHARFEQLRKAAAAASGDHHGSGGADAHERGGGGTAGGYTGERDHRPGVAEAPEVGVAVKSSPRFVCGGVSE
jgi:hypothetical protein